MVSLISPRPPPPSSISSSQWRSSLSASLPSSDYSVRRLALKSSNHVPPPSTVFSTSVDLRLNFVPDYLFMAAWRSSFLDIPSFISPISCPHTLPVVALRVSYFCPSEDRLLFCLCFKNCLIALISLRTCLVYLFSVSNNFKNMFSLSIFCL